MTKSQIRQAKLRDVPCLSHIEIPTLSDFSFDELSVINRFLGCVDVIDVLPSNYERALDKMVTARLHALLTASTAVSVEAS